MTVRRPTRDQIEDAASRLYFAEAKLTELRARLREYECEEAEPSEPEVGYPGTAPCWLRRIESDSEDVELCPACTARGLIFGELSAARKERAQRRRSWLGLMRRHVSDVESCASEATA